MATAAVLRVGELPEANWQRLKHIVQKLSLQDISLPFGYRSVLLQLRLSAPYLDICVDICS